MGITRLLAIICLALLGGCLPAADRDGAASDRTVIIVNAPLEDSVPGLAEGTADLIRAGAACCSFDIHWGTPVRAQERQRNLGGSRADASAAAIARSLGAGWAVLVSSAGYDREVTERGGDRVVTVTTAAKATVVTAEGTEIARFEGRPRRARRRETSDAELLSEFREPLLERLAAESAGDFTADLTDFLNGAVSAAQRK